MALCFSFFFTFVGGSFFSYCGDHMMFAIIFSIIVALNILALVAVYES